MNKAILPLLALALVSCKPLWAAVDQSQGCATDDYLAQQLKDDPDLSRRRAKIEEDIAQRLIKSPYKTMTLQSVAPITIPVVIHIVYNTAAQNLSDAQILSQMDVLNEDFRRLNADRVNTPLPFQSLAADSMIQFVLAKRDPSGNATNGITRTYTTNTSFTTNGYVKYDRYGGTDAWPRDQYLNIWVCNLSSYAGYSTVPGATAEVDGVVVSYLAFGRIGTLFSSRSKGRSTTHEIGHWLGLAHIWGWSGTCGDDAVADTPIQYASNSGFPVFPHITTCNGVPNDPNGDMFMSYMDYSDDRAENMFSQGQSARMNATLNGARASLLTSLGGVAPGTGSSDTTAPSVALTAPAAGAIVSGSSVTLSASASDNVGVAGVQFKLDGANLGLEDTAAPYSLGWNTTLAAAGAHTLTAVARDAAGNTATSAAVTVTVDNAAPVISGVAASSITSSAAGINWTTSEPANAQVEYGLSTAYGQLSALSTALVMSRSISLSGLSAGTLYHYRVRSRDAAGNLAISGDYTFSTPAAPADTTAPSVALTAPSGGAIVSGSAVAISANASDNMGVAGVQFKLDGANLGLEDTAAPYSLSWNTTLAAAGAHTLTAVARDAAGNTATSAAVTVTVDNAAPLISGVASSNVTASTATIAWTTNEASDSQVEYGLSTAYGQQSALNTTRVTSHTLGLSGLSASALYHYRVKSRDAAGNLAISGDYTLSTPAAPSDTTAPSVAMTAPAGGALVAGSAVTISANASDNAGVMGVQFKLDGANLGAEDTTAPYSLSWNSTLAVNGPHTLSATARDAAGNTATSAAVTITVDNAAPVISGIASSNVTASTATIAWTTNEASDSQVEYGLSTAYGQQSALNTTRLTSHSVSLSGLSSGALYHYRVKSRDQAGNLAVSGDFTFSTPAAPDTIAPAAAILSPASGANVKQDVSVKVSASDNLAVGRIELWADGALAKTQNLSPAAPSATVSFAWRAPTKGQHALYAKAYDAANNSGASSLVTINVTGKLSAVSLVGAGSPAPGEEPRAIMLSLQQAKEGAALAFSEDIAEAAITDMRGRAIISQSRQGSSFIMALRQASGGRQAMEAGVWLIQMKDDEGRKSVKPLVVVK